MERGEQFCADYQGGDTDKVPPAVRFGVLVLLAALVGGAGLLALSRGPAILIDLAGGVKTFFCL